MVQLIDLKCPSCAAALQPREAGGHVVCQYCGTAFIAVGPPRPAPPPPTSVPPWAMHSHVVPQRSGGGIVALVLVLTLASAGVAMFLAMRGGSLGGFGAQTGNPGERLLWDDVGGPPIPTSIAGAPAVIGRVRDVAGDKLYIAAYDANTLEERWRTGDLGTYMGGYQATVFGVEGDRVVYSDAHSNVNILERDTGKLVKSMALSDRVKVICNPPGEEGTLWLGKVDERHMKLAVKTELLTESPRPAGCPDYAYDRDDDAETAAESAPKVDGFAAVRARTDGGVMVVAGHKAPGTALPRAIGYDAASKRQLWDVQLPSVDPATVRERSNEDDALVGGHYYSVYGTGSDRWRVTALDAKTGARLWDIELKDIFAVDSINGLVATTDHVFVVRTSSMDILKTDTGALVGTIGTETYE